MSKDLNSFAKWNSLLVLLSIDIDTGNVRLEFVENIDIINDVLLYVQQ